MKNIVDKVVQVKANYAIGRFTKEFIVGELSQMLGKCKEHVERELFTNIEYQKLWLNMMRDRKDQYGVYETHNIVSLNIRKLYALQAIGATVTTSFDCNVVALGTDATPVTEDDEQLGNEIYRTYFTNRYTLDNVAYFDKFYTTSEVVGNTYLEVGLFADGDDSIPGSGFLVSHTNMNETISPSETLSINASISFNL